MSDTYGSEPQDRESGHDEVLTPENDAVHEPPSDYEFADEATTSTEHHEDIGSSHTEVKKTRSPIIPIIAALGGLFLLGAVVWSQLGGSSAPSSMARDTMVANNSAPALALPPVPEQKSLAVAPKTEAVIPPAPMAAEPLPSPIPPPVVPAAPLSAEPSQPANSLLMAAAQQPSPSAPQVIPEAATVPSALPPSSVVPGQGVTSSPDDAAHRIDALSVRLDALQKALDQDNQQLSQMNSVAPSSSGTPAAPSSSASLKGLQDRLDRVEQEMMSLKQNASSSEKISASFGEAPTVTPLPVHKTSSSSSHHKTTPKPSHKTAKKAPAAPAKPSWVLRAATPGHAWVANSADSQDLKQLQVGDSFGAIGKVEAIEEKDGNWVVRGTRGSIQ